MVKKLRHEKYIVEDLTESHHYLRVRIAKNGHDFSQTINVKDYGSPAMAMSAACIVRDRALDDIRNDCLVNHDMTVQELFDATKDMFAINAKTWIRHSRTYDGMRSYGQRKIKDIKPADIQSNINDYIKDHSADACHRLLSEWRQIYRAAAMMDIYVPDKTLAVTIPKDDKPAKPKKDVLISKDDFYKYIDWLEQSLKYTMDDKGKYRKSRIIYMLQIMYHTGCRPSEVMALCRSDIDLSSKDISITKRIGSTRTELRQIVSLKTSQSLRKVPIDDELMLIISNMLNDISSEQLFLDFDGLPFEITVLSAYIARTAKEAGVTFNMYMCRHSLKHDIRNADARVQMDILGHASYRTSVSYDRSSEDDRRSALNDRKS
ncbi:MAG: tyrosine-type recombinase/integrase [Solobacterium sp.]|nr:tyrosine-type recombinase/integrase [Solobacterium sp.]MCH4205314.1 tyrosine-type recombinase/integrase [Solobacterium sp.]MCH4226907.1 tyrosine-type recombinase/integrase [Solobacterium sp.]MCH4281667.1 tyrosine-type recombinase/integrase [Solobacterium sp.]